MQLSDNAIFQSKWLIDPSYAKANQTKIVQMLNDQILDQSALKQARLQQLTPQAVQALILPGRKFHAAAGAFVFMVNPYTSADRIPYDSIVIVDVSGPILKYGSYRSWGSIELTDLLIRLANTERVKGIILNIDSPGGEVAGTGEFAQTIREVNKVKPVIAVVQDGIAASSAYWIASACREVYLTQPTSRVGSIGIYATLISFEGMYEMSGIKKIDIYAEQSSDKNQDVIQALKGNETIIQEELKFVAQHFIDTVKANRGLRIKAVGKEPFTGKMYFAGEATSFGLIEGIKPMSAVVKRMEQLIALRA